MAVECAETMHLSSGAVGRAALATTELATNLVKHAGGGSIVFGSDDDASKVITIIALDKGAGIPNLGTAMRDGYSTAGSPGTGLGAISRAATQFDVYSASGKGTAVLCRVGEDEDGPALPVRRPRISVGGLCIAMHGESESGDAWDVTTTSDWTTITVVDGLGHGGAAATASRAATRIVREKPEAGLEESMHAAHGALRVTRGAAMAMARIHTGLRKLEFIGVGNIGCSIATDQVTRRTVSLPGIVGAEMRKLQTFTYPWDGESVLVMYSDGIGSSLGLDSYPGLASRDPALIAAVLYRDFCRGTDDATVVVAKS